MLHSKVNTRSQCLCSKMVRIQGSLYPNRVTQFFHHYKLILVTIGASTPSQNTCAQKRAYKAIMDNVELANRAQTDSRAFNYALPTTLKNKEEIIFLIQHNTPIHNVETCGDNAIADWARMKRREQRMRRTWKHAELLVKLKAVIY